MYRMGSFIGIGDGSIRNSLIEVTRQYLVGDLKRPQTVEHIQDERLEIGLTVYEQAATEAPHKHSTATEYQYVLSGWTRYIDTVTEETHDFRQGDFYAILPETSYAQKSKPGTRILFIKVPSINDKQDEDVTDRVQEWLESPLQTVRRDYSHGTDAPVANSIRPAVSVAVFDSSGRVLMLRRRHSGNWTLPGGTLEFDESLPDCAVREFREECGLGVTVTGVIGTYTDPGARGSRTPTARYAESSRWSLREPHPIRRWRWIPNPPLSVGSVGPRPKAPSCCVATSPTRGCFRLRLLRADQTGVRTANA